MPDTGVLSVIGLGMIGPTILAHAQPHISRTYLPAMYSGQVIACQLFSEPGAGSDLASLSMKAEKDEAKNEWVLNGQKVWTSIAQHADIGMALCRTNPDQPKHKGITAFIVNMKAPGVDVRPLRQMTGGADFNEVFLTDVRVRDDYRLGGVDEGWRVALTTLMNERATVGGEGAGPAGRVLSLPFLTALLKENGRIDDGAARRQLAALHADMTATEYLNRQMARRMRGGEQPGPEASVSKLMYGQNLTRGTHFAAEIVGPKLTADTGEWGAFSWSRAAAVHPGAAHPRRHRGDHEEHPRRARARPAEGTGHRHQDALQGNATLGGATMAQPNTVTETSSAAELAELRDSVRDFLAAKSGEQRVRAAIETERGYDEDLWQQMAEPAQPARPGAARGVRRRRVRLHRTPGRARGDWAAP